MFIIISINVCFCLFSFWSLYWSGAIFKAFFRSPLVSQVLLFVFSILRKLAWDYGRLALVTDADRYGCVGNMKQKDDDGSLIKSCFLLSKKGLQLLTDHAIFHHHPPPLPHSNSFSAGWNKKTKFCFCFFFCLEFKSVYLFDLKLS